MAATVTLRVERKSVDSVKISADADGRDVSADNIKISYSSKHSLSPSSDSGSGDRREFIVYLTNHSGAVDEGTLTVTVEFQVHGQTVYRATGGIPYEFTP